MTNPQPTSYSTVKTESISSKIRKKTRMPTIATLFNTLLKSWSWHQTGKKIIKRIQIGKGEVKLSLFADDMILFIKKF